MKSLWIIFLFSWVLNTEASNLKQNRCFEDHIQSSISLNFQLKNYYSKLTNKESDRIFNFLILSEKTALVGAKYFDRKAQKFHEYGVDLFCQEFLPMNSTILQNAPELRSSPKKFDWKKYSRLLKREIRLRDFEAVKDFTNQALNELKQQPHYYCFTRHLLESIYRFAYFTQIRENQSLRLNIQSPKELMAKAMEYQRLGFWGANRIDEMSFSIQMKGIPLLCDQLPPLLDGII
jgi:hypothetical protein